VRIAFYAPLKAPDHPTPSGDRRVARLLIAALRCAGHEVELAARLRSFEGAGNVPRQRRIAAIGARWAERLTRRYRALPATRRPGCWVTYHLYHKAPDWLGPPLSAALAIPYVVVEASHAPGQAHGPWAHGYQAAAAAIRTAAAVVTLNPRDEACVADLLDHPWRLHRLVPFIDTGANRPAVDRAARRARVAAELGLDPASPWLVSVAMMRPGDKLTSYRLLARALAGLGVRPWQLLVVGDGAARGEVARALGQLGERRVFYAGARDPAGVAALLGACDLYLWPAVNEAFGMALLEAAAAGLAMVAGDEGGVGVIVRDGVNGRLVARREPEVFAQAVAALLDHPARLRAFGQAARRLAVSAHGIDDAARRLDLVLNSLQSAPP